MGLGDEEHFNADTERQRSGESEKHSIPPRPGGGRFDRAGNDAYDVGDGDYRDGGHKSGSEHGRGRGVDGGERGGRGDSGGGGGYGAYGEDNEEVLLFRTSFLSATS